ncbi:MAG: hypothetical protein JXJ04_20030, partial [Spirochaetales bacterium]|nr:hypothetical protein [Spirochaetales bacterium]
MGKDIAIIGIAFRLPLANTMEEYWNILISKIDCVRNIPPRRKNDIDEYRRAKQFGELEYGEKGYLEEIDKFDYNFFKMSSKESRLMSPFHRLFLETVWNTFEDAGYTKEMIYGSNTGIFLGSGDRNDYLNLIDHFESPFFGLSIPGNSPPISSSRVSYLFNLKGPNLFINTTCSSSLVAVHQACQALNNGECEFAIAGGIYLNFFNTKTKWRLGIESASERSLVFDDDADGIGEGEGVAAILLKSLESAIIEKDNIHAVIKGSAVNNDGYTEALTVPNPEAQADVIKLALDNAGIDPERVRYIEAHGTGTKLGDPLEVKGLKKAFTTYTDKKNFCALGSVKANIGHLNHAAGLAGLIKIILILKYKKIPPQLHYTRPNKEIGLTDSPFYITRTELNIPDEGFPICCGVSSFGLNGTNCHVVLEEAPAKIETERNSFKYKILTGSAENRESLLKLLESYITYLTKINDGEFFHACYTSNIGRDHYKHRFLIICTDKYDCINGMQAFINEEKSCGTYNRKVFFSPPGGVRDDCDKTPDNLPAMPNLDGENVFSDLKFLQNIAAAYVGGVKIDWAKLYNYTKHYLISIPGYPYNRKRCWLKIKPNKKNSVINLSEDERKTNHPGNNQDNDTEESLIQIFKYFTENSDIDPDADFISEGIVDSIVAINLIMEIRKRLNVDVNVTDLFINHTLKDLTTFITNTRRKTHYSIPQADKKELYDVSSAQKRLFILNRFKSIGVSYNMPFATTIYGHVDENKLRNALTALIHRQESLRTTFLLTEDKKVVQKIHTVTEINPEFVVVNTDSDYINNSEIDKIIYSFIKPFNLCDPPLFRILLIRIAHDIQILLCDTHHIIMDGTSVGIFRNTLFSLYSNENLLPLEIQYKDFSEWQNTLSEKNKIKEQENYWKNIFPHDENIPVLNLPYDYKRPQYQSFAGDEIHFEISEEFTDKVKSFIQKRGITLFHFLITVYYILLHKYSRQKDIIIGVSNSGRNHADVKNIIGMFVNTLPLRSRIDEEKSFLYYLNEVKSISLKAFDNQDFQFEELIESLELDRDISRNPLFDVMFTVWNFNRKIIDKEDLKFTPYIFKNKFAKFDLSLFVYEDEAKVKFRLEYCIKLFKKNTVRRFSESYLKILSSVLDHPDLKLVDIPWLPVTESGETMCKVTYDYEKLVESAKPIEDVLNQNKYITNSTVLIKEKHVEDYSIIAYIVLDEKSFFSERYMEIEEVEEKKITQWSSVYDSFY